jgi:ABC-type glutathione transport system ATPase component
LTIIDGQPPSADHFHQAVAFTRAAAAPMRRVCSQPLRYGQDCHSHAVACHHILPRTAGGIMVNAHWPLLEADNLCVTFPVSGGLWQPKRVVHAVNQVTMQIFPGETLGLVGESGSGKSTLGRALLQLERVADGEVRFEGQRITHGLTSDIARLRQQSAMIFQDPYASLNPRQTVGESIAEVLRVHQKVPARAGSAAGCGTAHPGRPASAAGQRETGSA